MSSEHAVLLFNDLAVLLGLHVLEQFVLLLLLLCLGLSLLLTALRFHLSLLLDHLQLLTIGFTLSQLLRRVMDLFFLPIAAFLLRFFLLLFLVGFRLGFFFTLQFRLENWFFDRRRFLDRLLFWCLLSLLVFFLGALLLLAFWLLFRWLLALLLRSWLVALAV